MLNGGTTKMKKLNLAQKWFNISRIPMLKDRKGSKNFKKNVSRHRGYKTLATKGTKMMLKNTLAKLKV